MIGPDIFNSFRINVKRYYKFRGMYVCETNNGSKILSISGYTPIQIELQYNIKQHLIEKGFDLVDQFYMSSQNKPYVIHRGHTYIMTDDYNKDVADFYNKADIKKSIKLLGKLHTAGEGFCNLPKGIQIYHIKNLGEIYEKRRRETHKLKKKIENRGSKTDFEVLYLNRSSLYEQLQMVSKELVHLSNYNELIYTAAKNKTIVHGKYTYHNIVKLANKRMVITGFEKSGYNVQLTDLAYIIRRIMERNHWDISLLIDMIEEYNKQRPLSQDEWKILKGMIIFPDKFAKLSNQYYNSKRRWNYNMFYRKLSKILEYEEEYIECVHQLMKC